MTKEGSKQTGRRIVTVGDLELDLDVPADAKTYQKLTEAINLINQGSRPNPAPAEGEAPQESPQLDAPRITETANSNHDPLASTKSLFREGGKNSRSLFKKGSTG